MTAEQLAALAMSIRDNEAFQAALTRQWEAARDALCAVQPTDTETIRALQARVKVIEELRDDLDGFIRSGQPRKAPGIA